MAPAKRKRGLLASHRAKPKPPCHLLQLSDELLLMISKDVLANGDLGNFRQTCKKLRDITEDDMFHNLVISLSEDPTLDWSNQLQQNVPSQASKARTLTILNQCTHPDGSFYTETITHIDSSRLERWGLLYQHASMATHRVENSTFLSIHRNPINVSHDEIVFNDQLISNNQLTSFRWRHAIPMPFEHFEKLLSSNTQSLEKIEISMLRPPTFQEVQRLISVLGKGTPLAKLKSLVYWGLSHTEPLRVNRPERGGRFRMLRPILRKTYGQLEDLRLTQDHCISQVGKTPLDVNGRTYQDGLCNLEEMIWHADDPSLDPLQHITLSLFKLELGGFQLASLISPTTRIHIDLSRLRDLSLKNCEGLPAFFAHLKSRSEELQLKSFAIRYIEDEESADESNDVAEEMTSFLLSFRGLELLSVLWQDEVSSLENGNLITDNILKHHSDTIQVYTIDMQFPMGHHDFGVEPIMDLNTWGIGSSNDSSTSHCLSLREFSFNLTSTIEMPSEVNTLQLLSRYSNLRTVHIRNFPHIQNFPSESESAFWTSTSGRENPALIKAVASFAESIALPYFNVNLEYLFNNAHAKEVVSLAEIHARNRAVQLFGKSELNGEQLQAPPVFKDPTVWVTGQRADLDETFGYQMRRVAAGKATESERKDVTEAFQQIRTALGYQKPSIMDRPKLRLLIIGDWRYRDLMNLTGPRTWSPFAWSRREVETKSSNDDDDDDADGALNIDDENEEGEETDETSGYTFDEGFQKEWDVRVRPMFFEIGWKSRKGRDGKYRWKAQVKLLSHMTLEGQKPLYDVRSLEHAWE